MKRVDAARPTDFVVACGLAAALLTVGHVTVKQRSLEGDSVWFQMSLDATKYIAMVEGEPVTDPLFPPRFLVPWLASFLPLRADHALLVISYAGLLLMYVLICLILRRLQFSWTTTAASLGCLFVTLGHLMNYSNPFLTDVFALTALTAMLYCLLTGRHVLFGVTALAGIAGRETCLFGVPVFAATKRWAPLLLLLTLSVGLFLGLRSFSLADYRIPGPGEYHLPSLGGYHPPSLALFGDWVFWAKLYMPFGFLWVPMVLGLFFCARRFAPLLGLEFVVLLISGVGTSLTSSDITRMVGVVQVVAPSLWAYYLEALRRRHRRLFTGFLLLTLTNVLWAVPTVWFPEQARGLFELETWYYRLQWPIAVHQTIGLLLSGFSAYVLRHQLAAGYREKALMVTEWLVARRRAPVSRRGFVRGYPR